METKEAKAVCASGLRQLEWAVSSFCRNRTITDALQEANRSGAGYPKYADVIDELRGALEEYRRRANEAARSDASKPTQAALTHGYLTLEANIFPVLSEVEATLRSVAKSSSGEQKRRYERAAEETVRIRAAFKVVHTELYRAFQLVC